jgi:hypothetical protein
MVAIWIMATSDKHTIPSLTKDQFIRALRARNTQLLNDVTIIVMQRLNELTVWIAVAA